MCKGQKESGIYLSITYFPFDFIKPVNQTKKNGKRNIIYSEINEVQ